MLKDPEIDFWNIILKRLPRKHQNKMKQQWTRARKELRNLFSHLRLMMHHMLESFQSLRMQINRLGWLWRQDVPGTHYTTLRRGRFLF